MGVFYNQTSAFTGIDINTGGVPVAVLSFVPSGNISYFFTPKVTLDNLAATAANITFEVHLKYGMSALYTYFSETIAYSPIIG